MLMVMVIWYYCLYQYKYIVTTLRRKVLREPPLLVGVQSKELPVTACVTCEGALFARTTLAAPPPAPPPPPPAPSTHGHGGPRLSASKVFLGLYKILFHFEALLHNNFFANTPFIDCAKYCTILPVIAPPRPILRCF